MVSTKSIKEFVSCNDKELRYLVTSICLKHNVKPTTDSINEIVQDVYVRMIAADVFNSYKPNFGGHSTKFSTYLYAIIRNIVRGYRRTNESKIQSMRYQPPREVDLLPDTYDDIEIALRYNKVASEFQSIIERNECSDSIDGLSCQLKDFEERYLSRREYNKKYQLLRRKNKRIKIGGCSALKIYQLMSSGLTSHEIAELYGVSDMFVSLVKEDIEKAIREYGIDWKRHKRSKHHGKHKVS